MCLLVLLAVRLLSGVLSYVLFHVLVLNKGLSCELPSVVCCVAL